MALCRRPEDRALVSAEETDYPVASQFARRLIGDLCDRGFDPSHSKFYQDGQGMSHSFGYVYHRIMTSKIFPIIPVNINTYYRPTRSRRARAYQIGQAIRDAVESWPRTCASW